MGTVSPSRATTSMSEGTGQQTEANALTTLLNEFNGNIDGNNLKQTIAIAVSANGFTIGADTNLYRVAADQLKTDDTLRAAFELTARHTTTAQVNIGAVGPAAEAGLTFSNGADVNLYRSGANVLRTDDTFVAPAFTLGTQSVAPQAGLNDGTTVRRG